MGSLARVTRRVRSGRFADEGAVDERASHPPTPLTWLAGALGVAVCLGATRIGADARWLAAVGASIAHAGSLPHGIAYAAVPSAGWHDAPALGQLVFHACQSLAGDRGLVAAQALAVAVALAALAADLRAARVKDGMGALVLLAVVAATPGAFFVAWAELFSLALFPVLVLLLRSEAREPSRRIWLVVPLLVLWANLHGGALVGAAVLGVYLVFERARRAPLEAAAVLVGSGLSLLATPALLHTVDYYAGVLGNAAATEGYGFWAPLSLHRPSDLLFLVVAVPLLAAAVRSRPKSWELALLLVLCIASARASRNEIWLVLFAAVPATRAFGQPSRQLVSSRILAAVATLPLLVGATGLVRPIPHDGAGSRLLDRAAAVAAGSPVLAEPYNAELLALRGTRIWIGNPLDAFPRPEQRLYVAWLRGSPAGDAILRKSVRVVLVDRGGAPARRLASDARFREVARDDATVLYAART